jgi:hypothetical protein
MKKLAPSHPLARERRARYFELRREGMEMFSAGAEVGVFAKEAVRLYERWFQAEESGQEIIPGKYGPKALRVIVKRTGKAAATKEGL